MQVGVDLESSGSGRSSSRHPAREHPGAQQRVTRACPSAPARSTTSTGKARAATRSATAQPSRARYQSRSSAVTERHQTRRRRRRSGVVSWTSFATTWNGPCTDGRVVVVAREPGIVGGDAPGPSVASVVGEAPRGKQPGRSRVGQAGAVAHSVQITVVDDTRAHSATTLRTDLELPSRARLDLTLPGCAAARQSGRAVAPPSRIRVPSRRASSATRGL